MIQINEGVALLLFVVTVCVLAWEYSHGYGRN